MASNYRDTILELEYELQQTNDKVAKLKTTINQLCELSGEPLAYPDVNDGSTSRAKVIRPDLFFGKALATAVKEYLKMKGSAASSEEIYEALLKGGYEFTGNKKLWFRGLTISLSKNTQTFVYLKNSNSFGLPEFYPELKRKEKREEEEEKPISSGSQTTIETVKKAD